MSQIRLGETLDTDDESITSVDDNKNDEIPCNLSENEADENSANKDEKQSEEESDNEDLSDNFIFTSLAEDQFLEGFMTFLGTVDGGKINLEEQPRNMQGLCS